MSRPFVFLISAAILLSASPADADDGRRITILGFSGPSSTRFQREVATLLRAKQHELIAASRYKTAARQLDAGASAADVARVARRIGADGIVVGAISRRGPRYKVRVRLRAGVDGTYVKTITVTTGRKKLTGSAKRKLLAQLDAAIRSLPRRQPAPSRAADRENPLRAARAPAPTAPASRRQAGADVAPPRRRSLEVAAGISVVDRKLTFQVRDGIDHAPQEYHGTPVAGAYFAGELYPFEIDPTETSRWRRFGVSAVYDKVLTINSRLVVGEPGGGDAMDTQLPTSQAHWAAGPVYRHRFGRAATVKLSARYNRLRFTIDKSAAPAGAVVEIPNVAYSYLDPGASLRVPITDRVALSGAARYLLVLGTGELGQPDHYGDGGVRGHEGDLHVDYQWRERVLFRFGATYRVINFELDGSGEMTDRDGDTAADVDRARDRYAGGYATAGYLF